MTRYTFTVLKNEGNTAPITVHASSWRVAVILFKEAVLKTFGHSWRELAMVLDIDAYEPSGQRRKTAFKR
jgi:hypothetical protein